MARRLHAASVDLIPLCAADVQALVCPLLHEGHFLHEELGKLWTTSMGNVEACEIVVIKQGYKEQLKVLHNQLGLNLFEPTPVTGMAAADATEPAGWKLGFSALSQQQCPDPAGSKLRGRHARMDSPAPCALEDVEYATIEGATCFAIQPKSADDGSNQTPDGSDNGRHPDQPCNFLVLLNIRRSGATGVGCRPLTTEVYYNLGPHFNGEYIVPRECYDACLRREFCVGQAVHMDWPYPSDLTIGQCYSGTIQAVRSHAKEKPPYLTLLVRWDDGVDEEVSPWEILEEEVGRRLLQAGPTAVRGRSRRPAVQPPGALTLYQPQPCDMQDDATEQYLQEIDSAIAVFQCRQVLQAQQPTQEALQYEELLQWLRVVEEGEEVPQEQACLLLQPAHAAEAALELPLERQPSHAENNNPDKANTADDRKRKACLCPTAHSPQDPVNNATDSTMPRPLSTFLSKKLRPSAARRCGQPSGEARPSAPALSSPPQQAHTGHNTRPTILPPSSDRRHATCNDHRPPPLYNVDDPQGPPPCAHLLLSRHHRALHETALVIYPPPPAPSPTPLSPALLPIAVAAAPRPQDHHHTGGNESRLVLYSGNEAPVLPTIPVPASATFLCLAAAPTPDAPAALANGTLQPPLTASAPAPSPAPAATWSILRSAPAHGSLLLVGQHCWFIGSEPAQAGHRPPDLLAPDAGDATHSIIYFPDDLLEAPVARQLAPLCAPLPRLTLIRDQHRIPAAACIQSFSLQHGDQLCIGNSTFLVQSQAAPSPSPSLEAAAPRLLLDAAPPPDSLQAPPPRSNAPFRLRPSALYPRPTVNPRTGTRLGGLQPSPDAGPSSYSSDLAPAPSSGLPSRSTLGPAVGGPGAWDAGYDSIGGGDGGGGDGDGAAAAAAVLLQLACDSWPGAGLSARPTRKKRAVKRMGA